MHNHFLWPKSKLNLIRILGFNSVTKAEKKLHKMFPSAYPVLCSSGRVALYIAIKELNLNRKKRLKIFPFASHCVLNIVGQITSPTSIEASKHDIELIYHQWGYSHKTNMKNIIEDSVDSLYIPGSELLSQGGVFEIWSLNKILGTTSGGVLWCRNKEDAERIRKKVTYGPYIIFQWLLRLLSIRIKTLYNYWNAGENGYLGISIFQSNEIYNKILNWEMLVDDRINKLKMLNDFSIIPDNYYSKERLPCVINIDPIHGHIINNLNSEIGVRNFNKTKDSEFKEFIEVLPIPVHQDVKIDEITSLLKALNNND
tara:strand:- start:2225 stop:3163 length:939 start_codon:yes stop_codon:yes gene_type:complete